MSSESDEDSNSTDISDIDVSDNAPVVVNEKLPTQINRLTRYVRKQMKTKPPPVQSHIDMVVRRIVRLRQALADLDLRSHGDESSQRPLPKIIISVPEATDAKDATGEVTLYRIELTVGAESWSVYRRFRSCKDFARSFVNARYPHLKESFPDSVFSWFTEREELKRQRRDGLEVFFR